LKYFLSFVSPLGGFEFSQNSCFSNLQILVFGFLSGFMDFHAAKMFLPFPNGDAVRNRKCSKLPINAHIF